MNALTENENRGGPRRDVHRQVTERIIALLERGTVPWQSPWDAETGPPANLVSGRPYQGINALLLGIEGRPSPWWMTYRQALAYGGNVRRGERGTRVVKYGQAKPREKTETEDSGRAKARPRMFLREFTVFNASQIEGIEFPPEASRPRLDEGERVARAESVIQQMASPPFLSEGRWSKACYVPSEDEVRMPSFGTFRSAAAYYSVLFHEYCHSTGHPCRLARQSLMAFREFGDHAYSKEELVAEMGAALLSTELGLVDDAHEASASYLQAWLGVLKVRENRRWIVEAAGLASKAVDRILGRNAGPVPDP